MNDIFLKNRQQNRVKICNSKIKELKEQLYGEFKLHKGVRNLNCNAINNKNIISVFDSVLTRTLKLKEDTLTTDIMVIQTYYFDILKDIIKDGYMYNGEKYVIYTASAGQIRTKKTVFIKESLLKKHEMTLMCGLTVDQINEQGGVNINKYLAYLALNNSATDVWADFNIDKAIVVDDFETNVKGEVDFIDDKSYTITRKNMDIPIPHTDGCGIMLPKVSEKSMMVRLPWMKGLLVPFSFDTFIHTYNENSQNNKYGIVKDIYGKEWDLIKDDIQIIFTKSQLKMWKYYSNTYDKHGNVLKYGWDIYKENFKRYNCQAAKCNVEEDYFENAKLNYQMLQTLTSMTKKELKTICATTKNNISKVGSDERIMLRVLGVTRANKNKNYYQQALELYPELLNDTYSKEIIKQTKKKLVKEARSGKIDIKDAYYTFIVPDLYAFCEWLILGDENPSGLLKNKEVYCNLFDDGKKLDCLRSPHLFREHAIRTNVVDGDKKDWFISNGIYTSCHDIISKILMFDVDGDKSLVCADETIVSVAERDVKDIVPLYYNMANASNSQINNDSIYDGLIAAYTGGNIGMISNDISKIWNSDNIDIDVIKILCMENNFTIDYAKTLYKPQRPNRIKKEISNHTKSKLPHFFIYAKDKKKKQVEKVNNSVVNKLEKIITNPRITFKKSIMDKFDYKMLMKNKDVTLDFDIVNKYTELDLKKYFMIADKEDERNSNLIFMYSDIRKQILEISDDIHYVVDVLVNYLYNFKKSSYKTTLWECFGDVMVENLRSNIEYKTRYCEVCGMVIKSKSNRTKYCKPCWQKKEVEDNRRYARESMRKRRENGLC